MQKEIKKRAIRRLKILEGQIRGLQKMVEKEEYCLKILQQTSAVKQAISSIEDLILENHLNTCVTEAIKGKNKKEKKKKIKELLEIFKNSNKK